MIDQVHLQEWDNLVEKAKEELLGNCPLIEDETIVEINKYLKALELKVEELDNLIVELGEHIDYYANGD